MSIIAEPNIENGLAVLACSGDSKMVLLGSLQCSVEGLQGLRLYRCKLLWAFWVGEIEKRGDNREQNKSDPKAALYEGEIKNYSLASEDLASCSAGSSFSSAGPKEVATMMMRLCLTPSLSVHSSGLK